MLASIFYGMSSLILCVMISNATGPSLDYSHLSKPTATGPSIPVVSSLSLSRGIYESIITKAHSRLFMYNLENTSSISHKREILEAVKSYSFWSWRLSPSKMRKARRISRKNSGIKATATSYYDNNDHNNNNNNNNNEYEGGRPTYSPPAGYSVDDYEEYQLRHATSFNKSESGFCSTEKYSNQEQESDSWKAHMPISIPRKP